MSAREHVLLCDAERATLFRIPTDPDELARRFTLEKGDLNLIGARRHDRNRMGMALQFALIRHPGMTLGQVLQIEGSVPGALVIFLARQLSLDHSVLSDYATRAQTMTDHARLIAASIGVRPPVRGDLALMIASAERAAAQTDAALPIAKAIIAALRSANILLPMPSTIERAGVAGRARARKNAAHMMVADLSPLQLGRIDALFTEQDGARVGWLKTVPVATKTDSVRDIVERLRIVRAIGIPHDAGVGVHPNRRHQFVQEGRLSPAYLIQRYTLARRRAIIVALLIDLEARLIDAALDIADKLIGSMFRRATTMKQRRYTASSREVAWLMRLFHITIDTLAQADEDGSDPIAALEAAVGWPALMKARGQVSAIADIVEQDPLVIAGDKYATLRKFAPLLIEVLEFRSARGSAASVKAIDLLRDLNASGKRDVPTDAPMPFRKEWRRLVVGADGRINRRLYETATMAHTRNKLRSGDIWVERSSAYRRFDSYFLSIDASAPIAAGLNLPTSADTWLAERAASLDHRLKRFAHNLSNGRLEGVRLVDGRLQITPVRTQSDTEARALGNRIDGLMPRIRITELLHDVASETGFLAGFTNLRTGRQSDNHNALLAAILADGTNLGLARMAAASQGVTRDQLVWTKDAYVREDSYHRALAILVDAHHRLPITSTWGTGTTSSSDGQFFRGGKRMAVGDINARYGVDPGFSFYTHVSDQHAPYSVTVISAATHEAPYVLDGLLHHGSSLKIAEHYTDTGGATDHVFALCAMLGFRFCPRLRDFPDRRLAALGPVASYPAIGSLLGKRVKTDTIREHWGEVLRLVASLKAGHVAPSAMLRKLAAYERQNQVDVALQEIGKIERTFFMLDWLENPDLRRRCQAGLNKSEQRHVLTQAICTFRQGRIIDRTHETLQYRASGLNLVIAAIVYWNSTYIADAVQHLLSIGEAPDPGLLAHTSPVGWEHIAFSGDFLWDRAAETVRRKPLNLPGLG
jgi:TnpA family transposase